MAERIPPLAAHLDVPISFCIHDLYRPDCSQEVDLGGRSLFAQTPFHDMVIECQVWCASHHEKSVLSPLYSVHWVLHKDIGKWHYSGIHYSHLIAPTHSICSRSEFIENFISHEKARGPHLYFELKLPSGRSSSSDLPLSLMKPLSRGVISLLKYGEYEMTLKQGLQCVRMFDYNPSNQKIVSEEYDRKMQFKQQQLNLLRRQPDTWIKSHTENMLRSNNIIIPSKYEASSPVGRVGGEEKVSFPISALLMIELPHFEQKDIYMHFNQVNRDRTNFVMRSSHLESEKKMQFSFAKRNTSKASRIQFLSDIVCVRDYRVGGVVMESLVEPVEDKYRQLSWNLEPSHMERKMIQDIIRYPPTHQFTQQESEIMWNYRKILSNNGRALKKFLAAIKWNNDIERTEALRLLPLWRDVPCLDAIEILLVCLHLGDLPSAVYRYAVHLLEEIPNLQSYLLELVQILKKEIKICAPLPPHSPAPLFDLLSKRSQEDFIFCNHFYWLLYSDSAHPVLHSLCREFEANLQTHAPSFLHILKRQRKFTSGLSAIADYVVLGKDKGAALKTALSDESRFDFSEGPLPLPISPSIKVIGFDLEGNSCRVMSSNAKPLWLKLKRENGGSFTIMFKKGDDLRQDMLFMQILRFANDICLSENFDLHVTPYRVIPTSLEKRDGFIEIVLDSCPVKGLGDIQEFMRKHNPATTLLPPASIPYGIDPSAMDRFLRSCAAYCVVTYLVGVGDRHHGNVMMKETGELFHIDFGFLFGKDPKPFPPPFKLSPVLVAAMGGKDSKEITLFKDYCCETYNRIRSEGSLILAMAKLMANEFSSLDSKDDSFTTIQKLEEKFRFCDSDEEASRAFVEIIDHTTSALSQIKDTVVHDWSHAIASYWNV